MTETVSLAAVFLFETEMVDRIQAAALPGEVGSQRALGKRGFAFAGTMRKATSHRERSEDAPRPDRMTGDG